MLISVWLLLQKKTKKTKKTSLDIYIRVRGQIAAVPPFISLFQISSSVILILAKTVQIVPTE